MKKCVIVGGAPICCYSFIKNYVGQDCFFIYCDGGLSHEHELYPANLIVGDFDSYDMTVRDNEIIKLPCEKDDTDSVFAVKTALLRGFDDIILIGVTGGRPDHSLCNIYSLLMIHDAGKNARVIGDGFVMRIVDESPAYVKKGCRYFSLIAIDGDASGVSITGAKYELEDACITSSYQYGVSNEVTSESACVSVKNGRLLLIEIHG